MSMTRLIGVLDEYGSLGEYRRDLLATRAEVVAEISAAPSDELSDRLASLDLDLEWADAQQRAA